MIEEESGDWWSPTMDRGAGACLHFAAEHGQVALLYPVLEENISTGPTSAFCPDEGATLPSTALLAQQLLQVTFPFLLVDIEEDFFLHVQARSHTSTCWISRGKSSCVRC